MKNLQLLTYSAAALTALNLSAKPQQKPNVVFILVDDMGWKDLGCYGSDFHQTPNIDNFSKETVRFTNGYSACTVSSPTRASIMTGKYPAKLHLTDWIEGYKRPNAMLQIPDWTMFLPQEETTMAEILKQNGYSTAHIGKWHLGEDEKYWPENQGFDINIGGWKRGSPNLDKKNGTNGYFSPYGNPRLKDGPNGEYLTERLANEACSYIEKTKSKPFFLNLWFYNVHTPLQAKQDKIDKYKGLVDSTKLQKNPIYAAIVEHVDDAVGKVIAKLKSEGLYENTIIVFTSDNGGLTGNKNNITNNTPLRLGKGTIYEGGVRVPFMIKNAGKNTITRICKTPVISIDFLPTLIELTNSKVDTTVIKGFDGISLKSLIATNNDVLKRETIFWHYPHYHSQGATPYSAVRHGDWKLIHIMETNTYELYNLKSDIGETNDLAAKEPIMVNTLTKELQNWRKNIGAQMPTMK